MNDDNEKRILIVDDTPTNIRVLVPILMEHGKFQINISNNGKDALKLLEKVRPDLILLDIMMPELDGFETCRIIKSDESLKDIPIIFLTAKNETEDLAKGFALGAADFVSKPFNSVELMARVKTHIELKQNRDLLKTTLENLVRKRTEQLEKETVERLKLKDQLMQSQKMEAIGQLAGGVAHDFNNQLGGIIGSAELIKHYTDDPKINKYSDLILSAAQSSANLTKQLLAFARKGKETSMPVDLNKTILQITQLLQRSLDKKINLIHDFKSYNTFTIGDPAQLENAILNIAINAGHAMPKGGELTFSTSIIDIEEESQYNLPADCYACVKISDTGIGMSKEVMERIFEPFFTTKEKDKGTGLGLSATYGTIQQHGGAIVVDSELGKGSSFTILLPASQERSLDDFQHGRKLNNLSSTRVLLIDDEEVILFTVSEILNALNCKVTTASDGQKGIDIYKANPDEYDIIILDKIMPRMNGMEVYLKLKEIKEDVKVILASGYSEEQAQDILDAGVSAFIRKPYSMSTLSENLAKLINQAPIKD
ncbi:MAG: response regulator [Lentisphaeraceae bacterium]|nr:response regulator [Lentisphaeraceae bacterium]